MKNTDCTIGDYVLATKYSDGDPQDAWCVGFYAGMVAGARYLVADNDGKPFRANGFRRIKKISVQRGQWIIERISIIEQSNRSVWRWLTIPMNKQQKAVE